MRNIQRQTHSFVEHIPKVLVVGFISTTAMTIVMEVLYKILPHDEQYALPPEEIATVAEVNILGKPLNKPLHMAWTFISHFGYGITLTGVYSLVAKQLPLMPLLKGVLYGVTVWAGSYLGWLPAFHILRPATEFSPPRRRLMIIAHVIWGTCLGIVTDKY